MENISKYLEDKRFINWVFNSNDELDKWWKSFEIKHPKEKQNILLAKNVLSKFKTTDKELSEEEKIQLFTNVLKDIEEKQKSGKYIHLLTTVLKYAAVAILFFSIGALLFYRQNKIDPQYLSQNITEPINNNVAKLIRPNGESILLDNQRSVIEYTAKGKVKINNTTLDTLQSIGNSTSVLNKLIIPYGKTSEVLLPDGTKVYVTSRRILPREYRKPISIEITVIDTKKQRVTERKILKDAYLSENVSLTPTGDLAIATLIRPKNLIPSIQVEQGESGLAFYVQDEKNYYTFTVRVAKDKNALALLKKYQTGRKPVILKAVAFSLQPGQWIMPKIEVMENHITAYICK